MRSLIEISLEKEECLLGMPLGLFLKEHGDRDGREEGSLGRVEGFLKWPAGVRLRVLLVGMGL